MTTTNVTAHDVSYETMMCIIGMVCETVSDLSTVSDPIMSNTKYSIGSSVPESFFFSRS